MKENRSYWMRSALALVIFMLAGCEYVRPTLNAPLAKWDGTTGYRIRNLAPPKEGNTDSLFIVVAFSGGGTRASTLAFGVLRELARQPLTWEGKSKRLLDEVDVINALSGGTFTGAYYALFGDQIFHDFEYRFLRRDWESELKSRILLSPSNWFRLWSPYFGRSHVMAEILDEALFEGRTYADLLARRQRPLLIIHASDMATLSRFEFLQTQFDIICSDLSRLPVARASASSAALPLVLSPLTFKNYAGLCGYQPPKQLSQEKRQGGIAAQRANELLSYLDVEKRPYIHVLDGGLSDNMALRVVIEGAGVYGGLDGMLGMAGVTGVKKMVILSVNAETSPDVLEYRSDHIPVLSKAMGAMVDLPINRYSADTITLMRFMVDRWRQELRSKKRPANSPFAPDADIYFVDASFGEEEDPDERAALMKIPTTMYLTDEQIDRLLVAAARLLHNDKEFQRLMNDLEADRAAAPSGSPAGTPRPK